MNLGKDDVVAAVARLEESVLREVAGAGAEIVIAPDITPEITAVEPSTNGKPE